MLHAVAAVSYLLRSWRPDTFASNEDAQGFGIVAPGSDEFFPKGYEISDPLGGTSPEYIPVTSEPPVLGDQSRQVVWLGLAESALVALGLVLQIHFGYWEFLLAGVAASFGLAYVFQDLVSMPPSFSRE